MNFIYHATHSRMTVLLCLILATTSVKAIRVGTIGTQLPQANLQPSDEGDRTFCLNTANRANASGFISSVNYCYVPDFVPNNPLVVYQSTVGIYRPVIVDDNDEAFVLVDSFVITENPLSPTLVPVFRCSDFHLSPPIEVQTGYVFGVCSMNFGNFDLSRNFRRLIINAETNRGRDFLICTDDLCGSMPGTVPDIVKTNADINRRIMLVSANIDGIAIPDTTATDGITTTDGMTTIEFNSSPQDNELIVIGVAVGVPLFILTVLAIGGVLIMVIARKITRKSSKDSGLKDEGHIETTPNQVYGLRNNNQIETTPNQVHDLEAIKMSSNPGYRAYQREQASQQAQNDTGNENTELDLLYDYVSDQ